MLLFSLAALALVAPTLRVPESATLVRGVASGVEIAGLARGDSATLVAWRRVVVRNAASGRADTVTLRAAGRFVGTRGVLRVDETAPVAGTWTRADPYALLWSMERRDTTADVAPGRVLLHLEWRGRVVDSATLAVRGTTPGTRSQWVAGDGFAGAFAVPASGGRHAAVILLHGSEGGDSASARVLAESFAAQGYAAFALTYFAWGNAIPSVPSALVNVPVETVDRARAWLGTQAGVDTSRTAVWGASKGGELALAVAARRAWPRAVVGCVPSDVVWTGFGRPAAPGEAYSSWSDGGVPLRYLPYDRYEDALEGRVTARAVHDRSRVRSADSVRAATIPIARSRARLLLFGSDRDETWASGAMVRALADTLRAHGEGGRVVARTYAAAGHGICGTGSNPALVYERAYPTDTPPDTPPDARATAEAGADAWRLTVEFLRKALGG